MPDAAHLIAFAAAATTIALIPGPGMLYVLARSLGGGRDEGLRSSAGTGIGGVVHVAAAAAVLSAIIATSASAFTIVKYLDGRVVLQARDLHVGERLDEHRVEADGVRCSDPGRRGDGPVVENGGHDDAQA
jgi:hypothetical protein